MPWRQRFSIKRYPRNNTTTSISSICSKTALKWMHKLFEWVECLVYSYPPATKVSRIYGYTQHAASLSLNSPSPGRPDRTPQAWKQQKLNLHVGVFPTPNPLKVARRIVSELGRRTIVSVSAPIVNLAIYAFLPIPAHHIPRKCLET